MNSKHRKTLEDSYADPLRAGIPSRDIEALFVALDSVVKERGSSRVNIMLNGLVAVFHCPHPHKETDKGVVKSARRFLNEADIKARRPEPAKRDGISVQ